MTDTAQKVVALAGDAGTQPDDYAATVADFKSELSISATSVAQASREIGRGASQGTLSLWMNGKHRGNTDAVTARVRRWIDTRRQSRDQGLGDAGLDRHVDLDVTSEIVLALALAQAEGDIVAICGLSGMGKTWALERYCATHSGAHYVAMTRTTRSDVGMLSRVARAIGVGTLRAPSRVVEEHVVEALSARNALLVVDEAHHLPFGSLDELRSIRDLSGAGVALAGARTLRQTIERGYDRDPNNPIVGRVAMWVDRKAVDDDDIVSLTRSVLGRDPTQTEEAIVRSRARSPGGLHATRRLFARAWLAARDQDRPSIAYEDLVEAQEVAS